MAELGTWFATFFAIAVFRVVLLAGAGLLLQSTAWGQRRRILGLPVPRGQYGSELEAALPVIAFDAIYQPLLVSLAAPSLTGATVANVVTTVVVGFVLNELWFYASHRMLHTKALYFIHAQHHVARVTDPLSSVSFSLAEHVIGFVPITLAIVLCAQVLPMSGVGMAVFGLLTEVGNVYGHSNIEPWSHRQSSSLIGRLFGAPTFHALHHARHGGHYGLFTRVLDRACGTEFDDYEALQAQVAAGTPLGSLAERGSPRPSTTAAEAKGTSS